MTEEYSVVSCLSRLLCCATPPPNVSPILAFHFSRLGFSSFLHSSQFPYFFLFSLPFPRHFFLAFSSFQHIYCCPIWFMFNVLLSSFRLLCFLSYFPFSFIIIYSASLFSFLSPPAIFYCILVSSLSLPHSRPVTVSVSWRWGRTVHQLYVLLYGAPRQDSWHTGRRDICSPHQFFFIAFLPLCFCLL